MAGTTADLRDFVSAHQQEIEHINESILRERFHAIESIYFDLTCLKDTRLGLLLSIDEGRWTSYLSQGLDHYNHRPNRRFTIAYPELPYSENQLERWYHESSRSADIFNYSPDTDLSICLDSMINQCLHQNDIVQYHAPIDLYINVYPLSENVLLRQYFDMMSVILGQDVQLHAVYDDPTMLPVEFWAQHQLLFLDDVARLCAHEEIPFCIGVLKDRLLENATIFAAHSLADDQVAKYSENGVDLFDRQVQKDLFEPTVLYFSICTHLVFVPFIIPLEVSHG